MVTAANTLEKARRARELKGIKTDMERILKLPQTPDVPDAHIRMTADLRSHSGSPPLFPLQGLMLEVAKMMPSPKGIIGAVGVGHGKTLASFLLPVVWGCKKPVLLIPPAMRAQCRRDLQEWSEHYDFPVPHIVSYSDLSSPTKGDILEILKPDCIIADEAHCLRHPSAARTKRFIRYMQRHPNTRFAALSGTLTSKSLKDYGHLCELALRGGSPLPLDGRTLDIWSSVLDPDGEPDRRAYKALMPMVAWHGEDMDSEAVYRKAFQARFKKTLGIVASEEGSVGCSLLLREWEGNRNPKIIQALNRLNSEWELPNGEYLADALEFMRAARQLCLGFYYVWDWPNGDVDHEWNDARKAWGSTCGNYLRYHSREGVDSESLLIKWITEEHEGGRKLRSTYFAWAALKHRPAPPVKPVWITSDYIRDVCAWVKHQKEPLLIWFKSRAVGEKLKEFGIPVHYQTDPEPGTTCAVSIAIHHKGRNYQAWSDNMVVEPPSNGATWEQMLGRTHRAGQKADTVSATVCQDFWPQTRSLESAQKQAKYIEETTGNKQKLCYCDWTQNF